MVYVRKPKTQEWGVFSRLTPPKRPKKLTHGSLPKIWINPYIWQAPSNVLYFTIQATEKYSAAMYYSLSHPDVNLREGLPNK